MKTELKENEDNNNFFDEQIIRVMSLALTITVYCWLLHGMFTGTIESRILHTLYAIAAFLFFELPNRNNN